MDNEPISTLVAIPAPEAAAGSPGPGEDPFSFTRLRLIETPDSPLNSHSLPMTLEGCDGHLEGLPLKRPNVDHRNPRTIADMINVLTDPAAAEQLERATATDDRTERRVDAAGSSVAADDGGGDAPDALGYGDADDAIERLAASNRDVSHIELCFLFGWVTRPGCISLYNKDGKTYAVSEGRWILTPFRGNWM